MKCRRRYGYYIKCRNLNPKSRLHRGIRMVCGNVVWPHPRKSFSNDRHSMAVRSETCEKMYLGTLPDRRDESKGVYIFDLCVRGRGLWLADVNKQTNSLQIQERICQLFYISYTSDCLLKSFHDRKIYLFCLAIPIIN